MREPSSRDQRNSVQHPTKHRPRTGAAQSSTQERTTSRTMGGHEDDASRVQNTNQWAAINQASHPSPTRPHNTHNTRTTSKQRGDVNNPHRPAVASTFIRASSTLKGAVQHSEASSVRDTSLAAAAFPHLPACGPRAHLARVAVLACVHEPGAVTFAPAFWALGAEV